MLFDPITIRNVTVRNRVVMPAMHLNYTPNMGEVSDRLIEFYRRRAIGGAGLIIVGGCIISKYAGTPIMINISDDKYLPGLTRLASAMNEAGAASCAQLYHGGRYVHKLFLNGEEALSASAVKSRFTHEVPKEMTKEEIKREIKAFGDAAKRAKQAGFTMVEILSSAGYIINQFLSPITNHRTDEYGGSWENRMRFGLEVVDTVRAAVGDDYPVIIRVAGNDFMEGSNTNRETALYCKEVVKHGVDLINVTGGWHETRVPQLTTFVPRGAFTYLARGIKEAVDVPIVACNRITTPEEAERYLEEGIADMIGIARGMISDPDWVNKSKEGRSEDILHCIACAQGCFEHVFKMQPVGCLVNPAAGNEYKEKDIPTPSTIKKVLVVGGGLAGMEAAIVADDRGHEVTLVEETNALGGQFILAAAAPQRSELATVIADFIHKLEKSNVKVQLNTKIDKEWILQHKPDGIIIATGAYPITPKIPGVDRDNVYQSWDVLKNNIPLGKNVVIVGGGAVGVDAALHVASIGTIDDKTVKFLLLNNAEDVEVIKRLALQGTKNVTLVEMLPKIGRDIGKSNRWVFLQDLANYGIKQITESTVKEINDEGVVIEKMGKQQTIPADSVILAVGAKPNNQLYEEIKDLEMEIHLIGDAKQVRKAYEAVEEGYKAALSL